jgi:endonuclease/exonuclease/phosphatase (EEP) superfamily protein YafD
LLISARGPVEALAASPFSRCSGYFRGKSDCFARKGFHMARIQGVTFLNTHLDSGRSPADRATRSAQLAELSAALPGHGPLVVAGDLNIKPGEEAMLRAFLARHDLELVLRRGVDIIAVRGVEIDAPSAQVIEAPALSDHPALAVRLFVPA